MPTMTKIHLPDTSKAFEYFKAKNTFTTGPVEIWYMKKDGVDNINVVDVRAVDDYAKGHIPGSINLPRDRWDTAEGLAKDKANIFVCYSQQCHLASKAAEKFAAKGYPAMEMEGGFKAWQDNGLEIEK